MKFEDRVMQLCASAIDAEDEEQTRELLLELRELLHERIEELRSNFAAVQSVASRTDSSGPKKETA